MEHEPPVLLPPEGLGLLVEMVEDLVTGLMVIGTGKVTVAVSCLPGLLLHVGLVIAAGSDLLETAYL